MNQGSSGLINMNDIKPILAIETSGKICGACVYFSNEKYFEHQVILKHSHSDKIYETIDAVLKSASVEINDVSAIAVSAGPGSFTGLRIGMAAAKGLAFGSALPIAPVPTFEAMALQIASYMKDETEFVIANKVNSEELYYARFKVKANNYIFVRNLTVINKIELSETETETKIFGDFTGSNICVPSAYSIARWCSLFGKKLMTYDYDYLEPNYIKNFIVKGK